VNNEVAMPEVLHRLTEYTSDQLNVGVSLDGPCLMRDGTFSFFVSLRGKDGGAMPSPSELHWGRDVPDRLRAEPAHLFVRTDRAERSATYLGTIAFVRVGSPARDGFKILFRLSEPLPEATWRALVSTANAPPPPAPEEAIAGLTSESTTDDRVAAMRVFVERWYGTTEANIPPLTVPLSLPAPLRALHELTAKRSIFGQNRLVEARDLVVEDGKMVFYVENQGVCLWAIEPVGDDPPVFVRGNSSSADPWNEEAPTLSGFLIQALIYDTVLCAPFFGASTDGADAEELRKLERHVAPLALPAWTWSKIRFLGSNGIVGFAHADADLFQVELAAHDREPFEAIEDLLSEWPNLGF
jgi:hypothetical protein